MFETLTEIFQSLEHWQPTYRICLQENVTTLDKGLIGELLKKADLKVVISPCSLLRYTCIIVLRLATCEKQSLFS